MTGLPLSAPLPPGATIGILGGGQLGRMLSVAAAQLGYRTHIYAPEADSPAADVAAQWTRAGFEDEAALRTFAASVDAVTYEFENVPVRAVECISALTPVMPNACALEISQDRLREKMFVQNLGGLTAEIAPAESLADMRAGLAKLSAPAIVKTRRFGYDGKGQARLTRSEDCDAAWIALNQQPCLLESVVPFTREISVLLARDQHGNMRSYDPVENVHKNGILDISTVPSAETADQCARATQLTERIATALDYVGILSVEYFIAPQGIIFNEMAPRVHNSGHWTIEGAVTSQFENHIRAIAGLPLGDCSTRGKVLMRNLIGDDINKIGALLADPAAHVHHYGKTSVRPGRKMGHVTWVR